MDEDKPTLTEEFVIVLQWIGTSLEKLVDINMTMLSMQDSETAEFVEYAHKNSIFLSDLSQAEFDELRATFVESQETEDETDRA